MLRSHHQLLHSLISADRLSNLDRAIVCCWRQRGASLPCTLNFLALCKYNQPQLSAGQKTTDKTLVVTPVGGSKGQRVDRRVWDKHVNGNLVPQPPQTLVPARLLAAMKPRNRLRTELKASLSTLCNYCRSCLLLGPRLVLNSAPVGAPSNRSTRRSWSTRRSRFRSGSPKRARRYACLHATLMACIRTQSGACAKRG